MTDSITQALQALAISTSFIAAGQTFGASYLTIPPLYRLPVQFSAPYFRDFFYRGASTLVPLSLISAATNLSLAYMANDDRVRRAHTLAGVSAFLIQLWTAIALSSTNSSLLSLTANQPKIMTSAEVVYLLQKWTALNYMRTVLGSVSGMAGLYALSAMFNERT